MAAEERERLMWQGAISRLFPPVRYDGSPTQKPGR